MKNFQSENIRTHGMSAAMKPANLDEAFVRISFEDSMNASMDQEESKMYKQWINNASAQRSAPELFGAEALRKLYPQHSLVTSSMVNLLGYPGLSMTPISPSELITNVMFLPLARRVGNAPGALSDIIEFGAFAGGWGNYDFVIYICRWPEGFGTRTQHFILHEGPEDHSRDLIFAAGVWADQLHDEIWVYEQGWWQKDHDLWSEVQRANWGDVILDPKFKADLRKDIDHFFKSEETYKQLSIPWKRGLMMVGPPGNGKTISLKAVMKDCLQQDYPALYVKHFQSWKGEEGAMADVFNKARQLAPCILVLEDLDSLINDRNRSFFLNQLDGLTGNDGLLVLCTTNHAERLDPALSERPSRFDRKYSFDNPLRPERILYAQYWQNKLKENKSVQFPDSLVNDIADKTDGFSFAFLKEVFVSALVVLLDTKGADFASLVLDQIKELRKQIKKPAEPPSSGLRSYVTTRSTLPESAGQVARPDSWAMMRATALAQPGTPRYIY